MNNFINSKSNNTLIKFMFLFLIISNVVCAFTGCGSPRNHRVYAENLNGSSSLKVKFFTNYDLNIKAIWSGGPYPTMDKASSLLVFVYDSEGQLTNLPERLSLGFWALMPSMGHGPEDAGYFENIAVGIYENSNIVFQMPGDWQMEVSILDQNYNEMDKVLWHEFF